MVVCTVWLVEEVSADANVEGVGVVGRSECARDLDEEWGLKRISHGAVARVENATDSIEDEVVVERIG